MIWDHNMVSTDGATRERPKMHQQDASKMQYAGRIWQNHLSPSFSQFWRWKCFWELLKPRLLRIARFLGDVRTNMSAVISTFLRQECGSWSVPSTWAWMRPGWAGSICPRSLELSNVLQEYSSRPGAFLFVWKFMIIMLGEIISCPKDPKGEKQGLRGRHRWLLQRWGFESTPTDSEDSQQFCYQDLLRSLFFCLAVVDRSFSRLKTDLNQYFRVCMLAVS